MSTDLTRIGKRARKQPNLVFTSLYHHVTDLDNLRSCYDALNGDKAVGVDGVTKEQYGDHLEENLQDLSGRLKRMGYRPQPRRRSYIPKPGSERGRPLGISCFEDKIVELAVKRSLEPIYEEIFEDSSYGYRPGRSQHECLDELGRTIQQRRVSYVVESDIRGFFDEVSHKWMLKFLKHRIGDTRIVRLISRMLKGGIMEDGLVKASEKAPRRVPSCRRCCRTSTCTMRWTYGLVTGLKSSVRARRIIIVLPTTFWPAFSTKEMLGILGIG